LSLFFQRMYTESIEVRTWLKSIPIRYALSPCRGIPKKTKHMRTRIPRRFNRNGYPGIPSPCMMLERMDDKNRKGQIKLNIQINFPARELPNKKLPIHFPVNNRPPVQREPSSRQVKIVCEMVFLIFPLSFWLSASEIAGRIITETELVNTVGSVTTDKAIPVSTP